MRKSIMKSSHCKWWIFSILMVFCAGFIGCGDNPDSENAKQARSLTEQAVQANDLEIAKRAIGLSSDPLTNDSALLAYGNLAFAQGCQAQAELGMKRLPLGGSLDEFEKLLRDAEQLFVEKTKLNALLSAGDKEIVELKQLIDGGGDVALTKQLQEFNSRMGTLLAERSALEQKHQEIQAVLDDYQSRSDALLRDAELAAGDRKLSLEQQAYGLLTQRKDDYVEIQSVENQQDILNSDIELLQARIDGVQGGIASARARIEEIESSDTRSMLKGQVSEVNQAVTDHRQKLTTLVNEINAGYSSYQESAEEVVSTFKDAMGKYEDASGQVAFSASLGQAKSSYQAALTVQEEIRTQKYIAGRILGIMDVSGYDDDPGSEYVSFASAIGSRFAVPAEISTARQNEVFELFDISIAAYDAAAQGAGGLDSEARCGMVKSRMLALYGKMKLADYLAEYDLATETETVLDQVIQQGMELGDCFTQSEALQIVQAEGLDYMPVIPLNMQVFAEGKKQELQLWKALPADEREAAVDANLQIIEELTQQYGQDFARELESVKQEMLTAKEGGFQEDASGGNSFGGEPNSLY